MEPHDSTSITEYVDDGNFGGLGGRSFPSDSEGEEGQNDFIP